MKFNGMVVLTALTCAPWFQTARAQAFASGSTGAMGALVVTESTTLEVPADGIFHFTTVELQSGRVLTLKKNANNTPVHLLASGKVTIAGTVVVRGQIGNSVMGGESGPGGFRGGNPGSIGVAPGAGQGPGGGRGGANSTAADGAGSGAYGTVSPVGSSARKGAVYGSPLLIPLVGGSGGGGTIGTPGSGGGGGGGAILIASSTEIEIAAGGLIDATGGSATGGAWNSGSGGAIRLVAPKVSGTGSLDVRGGGSSGGAGDGRMRIDSIDRSALNLGFRPNSTASIGSMMVVFPSPNPRLDIIDAAGTNIPLGSGPVFVLLPFGSSPNRSITVQANDFNAVVPIRVALVPGNGEPTFYDGEINNAAANPATTTIQVEFPVNVQTVVHVWTR